MVAVMIGVDPHKGSHTAVVISPAEEPLGEIRVRASAAQAEKLAEWAAAWPERTWAVEGAAGLGRLLAQQLVGLGLELVVDPGCLTSGRVRQGESDSLRLRALKVVRPTEIAGVEGESVHGVALFGRQGVGYLRGKGVLGVQMNSEKPLRLHGPEGGGDDGTPIAALRGPSRVAETLHQLHPRACDARYSPPGLRGLLGEPEPGERRGDDVE